MDDTTKKAPNDPAGLADRSLEEGPDPRDVAPGPVRYWRWSLVGFAVLIALVAILSIT